MARIFLAFVLDQRMTSCGVTTKQWRSGLRSWRAQTRARETCSFDADGFQRSGICKDKFRTDVLVCDSESGPGAPSMPPQDDPDRDATLQACDGKRIKEGCNYGDVTGFCTGLEHHTKYWCYDPTKEKRPSQMACAGKTENATCSYSPDNILKTGKCIARAGGMIRCQQDEELCADPPPPTTTPAPPPPEMCSGPGRNCQTTKCCAVSSATCYEKDAYWAECKASCTAGIDSTDPPNHRTPWSCNILS